MVYTFKDNTNQVITKVDIENISKHIGKYCVVELLSKRQVSGLLYSTNNGFISIECVVNNDIEEFRQYHVKNVYVSA